jgi:hypothetical protein
MKETTKDTTIARRLIRTIRNYKKRLMLVPNHN